MNFNSRTRPLCGLFAYSRRSAMLGLIGMDISIAGLLEEAPVRRGRTNRAYVMALVECLSLAKVPDLQPAKAGNAEWTSGAVQGNLREHIARGTSNGGQSWAR